MTYYKHVFERVSWQVAQYQALSAGPATAVKLVGMQGKEVLFSGCHDLDMLVMSRALDVLAIAADQTTSPDLISGVSCHSTHLSCSSADTTSSGGSSSVPISSTKSRESVLLDDGSAGTSGAAAAGMAPNGCPSSSLRASHQHGTTTRPTSEELGR